MRRQETVLAAAVVCDRCGVTIREGESAIVEFDEKTGKCRFMHKACPGQEEKKTPVPRPRSPRGLVRGAVRARSTKNTNSKRKVRK